MICLKGSINVNRMEMDKFLDIVKEGKAKIEKENLLYVKFPYKLSMFLIKDMEISDENNTFKFYPSDKGYRERKISGFLICFSYIESEELVRIYVKPSEITYLYDTPDNESKNYKLIDYLNTKISEKEGQNDLEKYKAFVKDIILSSVKSEFDGLDILETDSLSLFEVDSNELFYYILENMLGENIETSNLYSFIINNFKSIERNGNYSFYKGNAELSEFVNKFGSFLPWILSYFKYIPNRNDLWYIDSVKCGDDHLYIKEEDDVIIKEIQEKVKEPLETMTIKTNRVDLLNSIYVVDGYQIWDTLLVDMIDCIREHLRIPLFSVGRFDKSFPNNAGRSAFFNFVREHFGGVLIYDMEVNIFDDMLNSEETSIFSLGDKYTSFGLLRDLLNYIITNQILIIVTDNVNSVSNYIESIDSTISVNIINGVDYVSSKRIVSSLYKELVENYLLKDNISKEEFITMIDIDMNKKYSREDEIIFHNQAKLAISRKIFPKLKFERSNKIVFSGLEKLNSLIGLDDIKTNIKKIVSFCKLLKYKEDCSYHNDGEEYADHSSLSMVFTGNPGTCKTTVAKILSEGLYKAGVVSNRDFAFVTRGDIVGRYVGHTAANVKDIFKKYNCGTIFIDEAYSLSEGEFGSNSFGLEAINELVAQMDEHRNTLVILAGYPDEMEKFINTNPGLKSRIGFYVNFKDYTVDELIEIIKLFADKSHNTINDDAIPVIKDIINQYIGTKNFGNGRFMRKVLYEALMNQSLRILTEYNNMLKKIPVDELNTLTKEDFENIDPYNIIERSANNDDIRKQIL